MKRPIVSRVVAAMFALFLTPAASFGQDFLWAESLSDAVAEHSASTQAQQARPPQTPPDTPRRRPSMVGYIEDSTVRSQIRLRFDAGFGNAVPDRAEFFYAKCGCYQLDPPPFQDLEAPGPGPGVPTELRFQQFYLQGEFAPHERFSLFAEVPIRAIQPQGFLDFGPDYFPFDDQAGLGDVRAGAKVALVADETRSLTAQLRAGFPTGDASKGLSTDTFNLEPTLLYHQRVGERVGLEAQIGSWHPFDGSAGVDSPEKFSANIIFYGIGPSVTLVDTGSVQFAPVAELVGWRIIDGFQTGCQLDGTCVFEADDNIVNLKVGARTTFAGRNSLYVGYGFPLTDAAWYDDIIRVEYRVGF